MADSSCSHWWHAPFYLAMSFSLALIAISTEKHSAAKTHLLPTDGLAFNASLALRLRGGYHITATLLQISPELFLSAPQTTIFAIQDSAISNLSIPPRKLRQLLRYHAVPSTLRMMELFKKPNGSCFKTLVAGEELAITKNDAVTGSLMINNVLVSHPDMFLQGPVAVHGIVEPFGTTPSPPCRSTLLGKNGVEIDRAVEWTRMIRLLSSNGFVSLAIALNAVLDGIVRDYENLGSVTVFAPPNSDFLSSPSPLLDRIVRLHILRERFSYADLGAARKSSLRTLLPGSVLEIDKFSETVAVNGVDITRPDLFSSHSFIIHGVARDFDLEEIFSSFQ